MPFRGTLLNTLLVLVGSGIGLALNRALPANLETLVLAAMGLINLGFGVKLFLETKNVLVPTIALMVGAAVGALLHLDHLTGAITDWARHTVGGGDTFNIGLITASLLFCVGPITLIGCVKDGLEHDIELLAMKSMLDFVASLFLAASLGIGVLFSAFVVLVVQGALTALARPLKAIVERPELIAEATATGGAILLALGLYLLDIKKLHTELFIPSLFIAPLIAPLFHRAPKGVG